MMDITSAAIATIISASVSTAVSILIIKSNRRQMFNQRLSDIRIKTVGMARQESVPKCLSGEQLIIFINSKHYRLRSGF